MVVVLTTISFTTTFLIKNTNGSSLNVHAILPYSWNLRLARSRWRVTLISSCVS